MNRTITMLALAAGASLTTGCPRTVVDSDDHSPPVVAVHISPDASYSDGTPFANPVDTARTVLLRTELATDIVRINAVGQDSESAISSVAITIQAEVHCRAFLEPGEPQTEWTRRVDWTVDNGEPDEAGTETYDRGNVIAMLSLDGFWRRADCGSGSRPEEAPIAVASGYVEVVTGTYAARACNNSAVAGNRCTSVPAGEFTLRAANNQVTD